MKKLKYSEKEKGREIQKQSTKTNRRNKKIIGKEILIKLQS